MSKFSFDGKVSLTFSNEMDFPADIADKLNDRDNTDTLTVVSKAEKKKEMTGEEKHAILQKCIDDIKDKYEALCYKHDGCRVLQALVKFGNRP